MQDTLWRPPPGLDVQPDGWRAGLVRWTQEQKAIMDRHPWLEEVRLIERAAKVGKPMLFHSGILWDGTPSSVHCRPALFEVLLEVAGLRFALAHISWPWIDECIAVYGKFLNAHHRRPEMTSEMFIDLTPGTPRIYRREALTKLLTVGYKVEHNLLFGTDCGTENYRIEHAKDWIARDSEIYQSLGISDTTVEDIFGNNLLRFIKGE
jgi:predicted TIM-barrel fold metal-dependent hydrolase